MSKIAVVTGANGFVGSHLVELLLSKGYKVKVVVRDTSNLKYIESLPIEIERCGLTDVALLGAVFANANYIFHVAGAIKAKNQEGYDYGNVTLTKNILEACIGNSNIQKILVTSSLAASGSAIDGVPIKEDKSFEPISLYGISKMRQEQLTHKYFTELPITIIRPPVVYGERDTEVFQFVELVNKGLLLKAGMFDKKTLSIIYVKDLVNGMLQAATSPQSKNQTYFITSDEILNWDIVGKITAEILNKKTIKLGIPHFAITAIAAVSEVAGKISGITPTLNFEKAKEMMQQSWTCSTEKAKNELGYKPYFSFQEGMQKTIDWYKQHNWL